MIAGGAPRTKRRLSEHLAKLGSCAADGKITRMTNPLVGACSTALALSAIAFFVPLAAQTMSADEKELAAYTLTMPTVKKVAAAMRTLNEMAAQEPKARELAKVNQEIETLERKDELTEADEQKLEKLRERASALEEELDKSDNSPSANTIDEMVAQINKHPGATAALAKEGLSARELAKCTLALFQAAMVKGFAQGKVDMTKLPAGINPANVKFVEEHEAELAEIQKEMQGQIKRN
jgi:hypothetical protein